MDAERHPGRDEIVFATNGPIALTIQGIGGAEVGDLNIIGELSLMGNITDVITIDASALDDRIFEIGVGAVVDIQRRPPQFQRCDHQGLRHQW